MPEGPCRRHIRHLREAWRRIRPSTTSGIDAEAMSGPARFQDGSTSSSGVRMFKIRFGPRPAESF
eukprot:10591646-Alexandrium_andersonii.AAC.1